jgi:hypothetical protein
LRGRRQVAKRIGRRRQLAFVSGMALIGGAIGFIPGNVKAQSTFPGNFNSFSSQSSGSSTDQAVASTTQGALRDETRTTVRIIDQHLRDIGRDQARGKTTGFLEDGASGLAAGSDATRFSVWADVSGSYLKNTAAGANAYQGWSVTGLSGLDVVIGSAWVAGLSAGYTRADFGVPAITGTRSNYGPVVGPYVSYVINEKLTVDGSFTYSRQTNDVAAAGTPTNLRHFSSDRWAGSVNGNYFADIGQVQVASFLGYTYAFEHQRGFADSTQTQFASANVRYAAFKVGGEFSYPIGNFEPYLPIAYEYQTTQVTDGTSHADLLVGIGLRYRIGDVLKIGLLGTTEEVRRHQSDQTIAANLRYSF